MTEPSEGPALSAMLDHLTRVIASRRGSDPEASYVASKLSRGIEHCAKKVGEEAVETAMAAAQSDKAALAAESADLLFHLLILWEAAGITSEDVAQVLADREGVSGHTEKAARSA